MTMRTLSAVRLLMSLGLASFVADAANATIPAAPLATQAKIERTVAERTALARVPGGSIKDGELEREHGHLVWSFDIQQPKSDNIVEVQVDAIDGKVISVVTETPADQAKEAAADLAMVETKP